MANSTDPPASCDIVVVGAGIVGLATARELPLRHPAASVAVLEREAANRRPTRAATRAASSTPASTTSRDRSRRASACGGAATLYEYCDERGIEAAARREADRRDARRASSRGSTSSSDAAVANGVAGTAARPTPSEIRAIEPHARGDRRAPLAGRPASSTSPASRPRSPTTSPRRAGRVSLGCEVDGRSPSEAGSRRSSTTRAALTGESGSSSAPGPGRTGSRSPAGADPDPRIVPFRGAYLRLRPERCAPGPGEHLPGARPRAAVPRRPPDPRPRRARCCSARRPCSSPPATPTGSHACARSTCARRSPGRAPGGCSRGTGAPGWPRSAAPPRGAHSPSRRGGCVPELQRRRLHPAARRGPRAGPRARRLAGRRLRRLGDRALRLRPQRALAGRDLVAAAREADRRSRRAAPERLAGPGARHPRGARWLEWVHATHKRHLGPRWLGSLG